MDSCSKVPVNFNVNSLQVWFPDSAEHSLVSELPTKNLISRTPFCT